MNAAIALKPNDYLRAARCPPTLTSQTFGLWEIQHRHCPVVEPARAFWRLMCGDMERQTALYRMTEATVHVGGAIVMEDSLLELRRHMPIWLHAHGRVLVTGLGLGCVVRGLLASPRVTHIHVVELDRGILRAVGPEFEGNDRVSLIHGDALECELGGEWDFAWHDIWCEGSGLQLLHLKLMDRFGPRCKWQGAWMLPRFIKRTLRRGRCAWRLIG